MLQDEARLLETLNRVGQTVAAELDLERVVQAVTDAGTELSGAAFGSFFYNRLDEKGEAYWLYTISGVPPEDFAKFPMPRNTAVFAPTFRGDGIVRSDDILKDPRYGRNEPYNGMPEGHLPVRSYLAVPVVSRSGEVLGGLFFGHPQPAMFTARSERLVAGIASQAAIAIDNARLFQAAQQEIAERRRAEAPAARERGGAARCASAQG
ncbi:MAG: GAF domain-containing protein [Gammaproteobacteria bacterium]